jgi:hypothetical protein
MTIVDLNCEKYIFSKFTDNELPHNQSLPNILLISYLKLQGLGFVIMTVI